MWLPRCLRPVGWMPEKIRTGRAGYPPHVQVRLRRRDCGLSSVQSGDVERPRMSPFTPSLRRTGLAALVTCGALAAPAQGACAPQLAAQGDPPTAGTPAGVALDLSQAAGEEAPRSLRGTRPGFAPAPGARAREACPGP